MPASADPDFDNPFAAYFEKRSAALKDGRPVAYPPPVQPWLIVCTANLLVPFSLGLITTRGAGQVGMVLGVIAVYWIGYRACFSAGDEVRAVAFGGWILAFFQFFMPIPQMIAGMIGLRAAEGLRLAPKGGPLPGSSDTLLGGLVATLITAIHLVVFARILGAIARDRSRPAVPIKLWDDRDS